MSEDKKIEEVISKYRSFLDNSDADISKSIKGVWHFYRYNEQYKNYDCFIRFKTASDLEHIILSEVADDMNLAMECVADTITYSYGYENIEDVTKTSDYADNVKRLIFNLSAVGGCVDLFQTVAKELEGLRKE